MPCKVEIPSPLREASGGHALVQAAGLTVAEVLADLVRQHPALEAKLFDQGRVRHYVNLFLNDEDIRYLDELATVVPEGATLALVPAVAGG